MRVRVTLITWIFTISLVHEAACSLALDANRNQCSVDADCEHFGGHPQCQVGVCVPSGLGPAGCFFGEPQTPEEFANQCTTSQAFPFDNCARAGLCTSNAVAGVWNVSATPTVLGATPPPVNGQVMPSTPCAIPGRNIIYVTGSTNLPPLVKAVQRLLSVAATPYTVVYLPQTSCKGAAAIYDADPTKHVISNITGNWAFYYENDVQTFCLLADGNGGVPVDVGESDVYPQSCSDSYGSQTPNVADYHGPIQAITFVVPMRSTQTSISAEAAHLIFGDGGAQGSVPPWTDPHLYFIRSSGTGTTQLPSLAIHVPATAWWGIDRLSADNLVSSMETVDPNQNEKAIGILSSDFADRSRSDLRELAFQQEGQSFGYLPDSTPLTFDKANVRDGHYPIWGAIHFFAVTNNSVPTSQAALAFINQFVKPELDQSLVAAIIDAGFVPPCAMKVTHTSELGPLSALAPSPACGCFFDQQVNHTTTCRACRTSNDCPSTASVCNYGYCEAQ